MPGLRYTSQSPLQFSEGYLAFILCFCLCVFSLSPSVCVSVSVSLLPLSASLTLSVSVSLLPLSVFLSACLFVYLMSVFICLALCLASSRSVFTYIPISFRHFSLSVLAGFTFNFYFSHSPVFPSLPSLTLPFSFISSSPLLPLSLSSFVFFALLSTAAQTASLSC